MPRRRPPLPIEKPDVTALLDRLDRAERTKLEQRRPLYRRIEIMLVALLLLSVAGPAYYWLSHPEVIGSPTELLLDLTPYAALVLLYALMRFNNRLTENELGRFKLAVEYASDHIIITDPKARIIYANRAVERTTGYQASEVLGRTPAVWGGKMPERFYRKMWRTISVEKRTFIGEITNRRKNGETYIAESRITPILNRDGVVKYFVGIERDITKAKEVDRAKTEFVSLASHQLRTPLSTVNWYTEILLAGDAGKLSSDQQSYLDAIYTANKRMTALVNDLLNVSRLELGTMMVQAEPLRLSELLEVVTAELAPVIERKHLTVRTQLPKRLPTIHFDRKMLQIILQNLLTNAVKYTPPHGEVRVKATLRPNHRLPSKRLLELSVIDTGYGIPIAEQKEIFSKLFRASNAREKDPEGTGLGLYLTKQIIEVAGGKIAFKSREGVGTSFTVSLPVRMHSRIVRKKV